MIRIYPDGSHDKYVLDAEGNILKRVHPNAYDEKTKDGEGTRYEYDGEGNLLRIRYPDGGVERFLYDEAGNMIKHILPERYEPDTDNGKGKSYEYDAANRLTAIMGEDGTEEARYEYDLWGNCVGRQDADGHTTRYAYDLAGRRIRKLEPFITQDGSIRYCLTTYAYDNNGNPIRETRHGGSYEEDGTLKESGTDLVLSHTYDARNRLVRTQDNLGAGTVCRYDVRGNKVSEEQVITAAAEENGERIPPVLRKIRYTYDRAGRMTEKREQIDSGLNDPADTAQAAMTAITRYRYDRNGNRIQVITPEGYRIHYAYDERNRLIMERVEDTENGIDLRTHITYDRAGNILSVKQQDGEGTCRHITCRYDLKDRLTHREETDGPFVYTFYDKNDRISQRKESPAAEDLPYRETAYHYDDRGNPAGYSLNGIRKETNRYDRQNRPVETADADGVELHRRYGTGNQPKQLFTAGGEGQKKAAQTFTYNARGQLTGIEDGCGQMTRYTPDEWGRITSVENAEGGREYYAYNHAGNIMEATDANGGIIRYAYNSQGKVCRITDRGGRSETFRYDREGRETEHTDRRGVVTHTRYNVYGQPVLKVCTDTKGRREIMGTWEYDSFGNLKKAVAGGFCYTYEYRPDGKLIRKWSSGRKVTECTYYRDGSLKTLTDVTGKSTVYKYDPDGNLKSLSDESGKILTEYRYTKAGRLKEILTPEGINTTYGYDEEGNLKHLRIQNRTDGNTLYDAFMLYDLNGNRIKKSGLRMGTDGKKQEMEVTYRYDCLNRLTEECRGTEGETYTYDPVGNRLKKEHYIINMPEGIPAGNSLAGNIHTENRRTVDGTETYCYNERNELTLLTKPSGTVSYRYDTNGNLLCEETQEAGKKSVKEYSYDLLNRLTHTRLPNGREYENRYDGEGLRAGIKEQNKSTMFLYHNGEVLAECGASQTPQKRYLRGMGISHMQTMEDQRYHTFHTDEKGSTAYITGENSRIENSYRYDVFGSLLETQGETENRILYTGQQYDRETEQYYLRARYYNPMIGRFIQEDTYHGDGLNLYAYCKNNPVTYYDPSGHDAVADAFAGYKKTETGMVDGSVGASKSGNKAKVSALPEPSGTNPWLEGSEIIATRAPKDCYINMALAPGQTKPGGWGTFDNIPDVNYVRNNLAVTPEFKPEVGYVQRYLIPEGTPIQIGIVGPQKYQGVNYPGGGNQVQILNFSDRANLIPIDNPYEIF